LNGGAKSYAPQVIADKSGEWAGNGLRFATHEEAYAWGRDLWERWVLVTDTRVVESDDPVRHAWIDGKLVTIASTPA